MKVKTLQIKTAVSRSEGVRLTLLLVLVVLTPSACLFWFMNQAARNEHLVVRQKLADAYRGHLTLAQEKLEVFWQKLAGGLDAELSTTTASEFFARQVRAQAATAVVCYDELGSLAYPLEAPFHPSLMLELSPALARAQALESADPLAAAQAYAGLAEQAFNPDIAAQAYQAQARCLIRSGKKPEALAVLTGPLSKETYRRSKDSQGRLVVPSAELMALELLKQSSPDQARTALEQLTERLMNYSDPTMSSAQRRFLMRQVKQWYPDREFAPFLAAEDLASRYAETAQGQSRKQVLSQSTIADVWQFGSKSGRVVQLHSIKSLMALMRAAIESKSLPEDVRIDMAMPGKADENALMSIPAGAIMPGWRLSLNLKDQTAFDAAARQRISWNVWIGILVVIAVSGLAMAALRLVRRQSALAELKNDLVANVTHELKTPLSSMRLLVDTLLNSEKINEQTAREYLQLIAKENERLSRLIDNFLTFSRIERNKYTFDFKSVSTAAIVETAAASVRERFHAAGCQFETSLPQDLPRVIADADAMAAALLNLLENAFKYSEDNKKIRLSAGMLDGSVFFAVEDNGIGLSPRETKQIFKRFYQVDQRLCRSNGGCGLGLSIVNFIVTAHKGTIQVQSSPGCGSKFIITLPINKAASNQEPFA